MRKFIAFAVIAPLASAALGMATTPEVQLAPCVTTEAIAASAWQAFDQSVNAPTDGTRVEFMGQGTCAGNYTVSGYTFAVTR